MALRQRDARCTTVQDPCGRGVCGDERPVPRAITVEDMETAGNGLASRRVEENEAVRTVVRNPERDDITFPIEEQLIVEFYSRV